MFPFLRPSLFNNQPFLFSMHLSGGSFCHIVTQGYYFINATHVPRACPSGSYTNIDGANNCSLCPKGYTSNESPNKGADGCQACSVGQYANTVGAPKCSQVPAGYASNRTVFTQVYILEQKSIEGRIEMIVSSSTIFVFQVNNLLLSTTSTFS